MAERTTTLNQLVLNSIEQYGDRTCFQYKRNRRFEAISYRQFFELVLRLVRFFQDKGVAHGERVAILASNSLEWMVSYVAGLLAGGIVVPLPVALAPNLLRFILRDAGVRLLVLQRASELTSMATCAVSIA